MESAQERTPEIVVYTNHSHTEDFPSEFRFCAATIPPSHSEHCAIVISLEELDREVRVCEHGVANGPSRLLSVETAHRDQTTVVADSAKRGREVSILNDPIRDRKQTFGSLPEFLHSSELRLTEKLAPGLHLIPQDCVGEGTAKVASRTTEFQPRRMALKFLAVHVSTLRASTDGPSA